MTIYKDGKEYTVTEQEKRWIVSRKIDALTIEYKVPKSVCAGEAELRAYVEREEIF